MGVISTVIWVLAVICAVWVIVDVLSNKKMSTGAKVAWIVCAILFSIITAIVYYLVNK